MVRKQNRRQFLIGTGVTGIGALAGCTSGGGGGDDGGDGGGDGDDGGDGGMTETDTETGDGMTETETETEPQLDGSDVDVGMVYATGGLGDKSFNDQAQRGAEAAREDFGISFEEVQPEENTDFPPLQRQLAQSGNFDLINCIGFAQTDALTQNAQDYPDQHWAIVDSVVEQDNVANYVFKEHEGSYLAGQLAGMLTTMEFSAGGGSTVSDSTNVGFVGGLEVPLIQKFQAGYEAGVSAASDDVDVSSSYVGSFNDPQGGKEAASSMYSSGADIVYHAAGATGSGVFQAAQEAGRFAIGVDRDQSVTAESFSNVILASMVKRVNTAVYSAIQAEVAGEFPGGGVETLGLASNGVELVYGQDLGSAVPSEVKDEIAASRQSIIDGETTVPDEL